MNDELQLWAQARRLSPEAARAIRDRVVRDAPSVDSHAWWKAILQPMRDSMRRLDHAVAR